MSHQERLRHQRLAAIALRVPSIEARLQLAYVAANITAPDGYGSGGSERVSGGEVSRPVESVVVAREGMLDSRVKFSTDDNGQDVEELRRVGMAAIDTSLKVILGAMSEIDKELDRLVAPFARQAEVGRTNMADCAACLRPVANTPSDRIRSGYCGACYMAWTREGRPERVAFERTRRGVDTTPHVTVRDSGRVAQVEVTVEGVTVTLPPDLSTELAGIEHPTTEDLHRLHAAAMERKAS